MKYLSKSKLFGSAFGREKIKALKKKKKKVIFGPVMVLLYRFTILACVHAEMCCFSFEQRQETLQNWQLMVLIRQFLFHMGIMLML